MVQSVLAIPMKIKEDPVYELSECPNCGDEPAVWNDISQGFQCDNCGYLDV